MSMSRAGTRTRRSSIRSAGSGSSRSRSTFMPKLIKNDAVIEDAWTRLASDATIDALPAEGPVLVPLALWLQHREQLLHRGSIGVWLSPSDDPAALAGDVGTLELI